MNDQPLDQQTIADRIRKFLTEAYAAPGVELSDTTHLLDDFFIDSFGIIDAVMFLEDSFGIQVEQSDINGENFKNIASLSEYVHSRLRI
jgi:acyl carrier protein